MLVPLKGLDEGSGKQKTELVKHLAGVSIIPVEEKWWILGVGDFGDGVGRAGGIRFRDAKRDLACAQVVIFKQRLYGIRDSFIVGKHQMRVIPDQFDRLRFRSPARKGEVDKQERGSEESTR